MVFKKDPSEMEKVRKEYESKQENLEKLVGQLTVEVDWLKKIWTQINLSMSVREWLESYEKAFNTMLRSITRIDPTNP